MTKRLIFLCIAMLTLMAAPAQASGTASALAKVSLSITDLQLDPGLEIVWGALQEEQGEGLTYGNGGFMASADHGFMGTTGFWSAVAAEAMASAPPNSGFGGYASVYSGFPPLMLISNSTAAPLALGFTSTGEISTLAVAAGAGLGYVYGTYLIAGYCFECVSTGLVYDFSLTAQYYVGSLANEPDGPRGFSDLRSEPFSFSLPAGANLYISVYSAASAFTQAEGSFVPEPRTWAMMIAGFGLVGGVLRRRRLQLS